MLDSKLHIKLNRNWLKRVSSLAQTYRVPRLTFNFWNSALQAAKAAEAALAGKQSIVEQLEQEVREAEAVVQEEGASLQQAQANVNAA